jgi:hypothetical protein
MSNPISIFVWVVFTIFMSGFLGYMTGTVVNFNNLITFNNLLCYLVGFITSILSSSFMAWFIYTFFYKK